MKLSQTSLALCLLIQFGLCLHLTEAGLFDFMKKDKVAKDENASLEKTADAPKEPDDPDGSLVGGSDREALLLADLDKQDLGVNSKLSRVFEEQERISKEYGRVKDDSDEEYSEQVRQEAVPQRPRVDFNQKPADLRRNRHQTRHLQHPEEEEGRDGGEIEGEYGYEAANEKPRRGHRTSAQVNRNAKSRLAEIRKQDRLNRGREQQKTLVSTKVDSPSAIDVSQLVPEVKYRYQTSSSENKKYKLSISGKGLKSKFKTAYKSTLSSLKPVAGAIVELPKYVSQASESLSAMLQLDSKGRILALIQEVNDDIKYVKKEFSSFSLSWSPLMEKALNYIGTEDLLNLKWKSRDEFDFREDALISLAFGFEFMRLMVIWRENLLVAHYAYKTYLQKIKDDITHQNSTSPKILVDEQFILQLHTKHNYMLYITWETIDRLTIGPIMKLEYLMDQLDDQPKNYEREYFRNAIVFQEMYEPTIEEFEDEKNQVVDILSKAGALDETLSDVDSFFERFRNRLAENKVIGIDWEVPKQLEEFLVKLAPQVDYNPIVYTKSFLSDLKDGRKAWLAMEAEKQAQ